MTKTPSIKLITLNVHRSKHLDLIFPFLEREQPDVLCVQELCAVDTQQFCKLVGEYYQTVPLTMYTGDAKVCLFSIGIFSRYPISASVVAYYSGSGDELKLSVPKDEGTINRALLRCDVVKDGEVFRIGTTHFTWTPDGEADDRQRNDLKKLFAALETQGDIVFTGDFNAPRGKEIFSQLAERYCDNVPSNYITSIDGSLHRAGALLLMVDGIFSTPGYEVNNIRMVCGVSDHCALVAEVRKGG